MDLIWETIAEELRRSNILLSVFSPSYVNSESCRKELLEFLKHHKAYIDNKVRIIKIIRIPVSPNDYPEELRVHKEIVEVLREKVLGYEFFFENEKGRGIPLDTKSNEPRYYEFQLKTFDTAYEIKNLLARNDPERQLPKNPPEKTIYLAETTSDLQFQYNDIRLELENQGYSILPEGFLPTAGSVKDSIREFLTKSGVSLHLIGEKYGLQPEDSDRSLNELQYEIAAEFVGKGLLKKIVWIPQEVNPSDDRQKLFIDKINKDPQGAEIVRTECEDLKTIISDKLSVLNQPETPARRTGDHQCVYLVYDREDEKNVQRIRECLIKDHFEVLLPLFDGEEQQIRRLHFDNLRVCDAILIYWGHASEFWFKTKFNDLFFKIMGHGRTESIPHRMICIMGNETERKKEFRTPRAKVYKNFESFTENAIREITEDLKKSFGTRE